MSSNKIAIRVQNLSKCYQLYAQPQDRLKQSILPRFQRWFGRVPSKYYSEFWALNDVTFEVKRGETVGIIGRNGSGKSTLLQLICETLTPTCGSSVVQGRVAALLELGAGFNPEFTGRENVYMNGAILGISKSQMDKRFTNITKFADIGEFIDQPVKNYSSGMLVRLAFSVAINVDADILVIDEALAVGDIFFTQKCLRFLNEFRKSGTLLFVSHDLNMVQTLCETVILLKKGLVCEKGDAKQVTKKYIEHYYETRNEEHYNLYDRHPKEQTVINRNFNENIPIVKQVLSSSGAWISENVIQISNFNAKADFFGTGGAQIYDAGFFDSNENKLSTIYGSKRVTFFIKAKVFEQMGSPALGFIVKNREGRIIFDLSTYFPLEENYIQFHPNEDLITKFSFIMPVLPKGELSISVAIAEGGGM